MNKLKINEIHWSKTIPVRHQVLWPNKPKEFCHIDDDELGWHFGAYINSKLISVASLYPIDESVRLRKFATIQGFQGKGIGSSLLNHVLLVAKEKEIIHIWCDARESATHFYSRFGLSIEGEKFYKSGIPYFKMSKQL